MVSLPIATCGKGLYWTSTLYPDSSPSWVMTYGLQSRTHSQTSLRDNHCNAAEVLCLGSYSKDISSVLVLLDYGYDFKVQTEN